jgi:hypothetical protein
LYSAQIAPSHAGRVEKIVFNSPCVKTDKELDELLGLIGEVQDEDLKRLSRLP